ncbi:hypothetical protein ACC758_39160, partial [Rhizobium ruizarguesonis]
MTRKKLDFRVAAGNSIEDLAGKNRHHDFGKRAGNDQHNNNAQQYGPMAPMMENKAEHMAIGIGA